MKRSDTARAVLLLDAVGRAATAGVVLGFRKACRVVDPDLRFRLPVALVLVGTAVGCAFGVRTSSPSRGAMSAVAMMNVDWTAACLAVSPSRRDALGRALVLTTALLDGVVGGLQRTLRGAGQATPRDDVNGM